MVARGRLESRHYPIALTIPTSQLMFSQRLKDLYAEHKELLHYIFASICVVTLSLVVVFSFKAYYHRGGNNEHNDETMTNDEAQNHREEEIFLSKRTAISVLKKVGYVVFAFVVITVFFKVTERALESPNYNLPQYECFDKKAYETMKKLQYQIHNPDERSKVQIRAWRSHYPVLNWFDRYEHRWVVTSDMRTFESDVPGNGGSTHVSHHSYSCFDPANPNDPKDYNINDKNSYEVISGCILYQKHAQALRDLLSEIFQDRKPSSMVITNDEDEDVSNNSAYGSLVQMLSYYALEHSSASAKEGHLSNHDDEKALNPLDEMILASSKWKQLFPENHEAKKDIFAKKFKTKTLKDSLQCIAPMYSVVGTLGHGIAEHFGRQ